MSEERERMRRVGDLTPAPYNPRAITIDQKRDLDRSMDEDGDLSGIVVNRRTGHVLAGNQRHLLLDDDAEIVVEARYPAPNAQGTVAVGHVASGGGRFAYREVDWDLDREKRANVKANALGGAFLDEPLSRLLQQFSEEKGGLEGTGFDNSEMSRLLARVQGGTPYHPSLLPDLSVRVVTDEEVEHKKEHLETVHGRHKEYEDVACPACGRTFYLTRSF